jgi:hypothetical protein
MRQALFPSGVATQDYCNQEGFNLNVAGAAYARIGLV